MTAYLKQFADGARTAQRMRDRARRQGYAFGGKKVWTSGEDEVCRLLYPQYRMIERLLPHRTRRAIQARCQKIGLSYTVRQWGPLDKAKLRRLYPKAPWSDIKAALPDWTVQQIRSEARYLGIKRERKPYKPTGYRLLDQARDRIFDLNMYMRDADAYAGSRRYFYKAGWHSGWRNDKAICRLVRALGGQVVAVWDD